MSSHEERVGRRAWMRGAAALALGTWASTARADDDVDAALADVAKARASLRTLVGPFTQERTIGLLAQKVRSTGTLTLVRPDRLRWELDPPDAIVYWVGPEGLAYKSARGEGRMALGASGSAGPGGKLTAALDDVRTVLGGDLGRLRERYDLAVVSRSPEIVFRATPRAALTTKSGARLERIDFALDIEHACPVRTTLVEGPRDKTEIVFGKLTRDAAVDPARVRPSF